MSFLPETGVWPVGVYQLEVTDPVRGGDPAVAGVANVPLQQLAVRTAILKTAVDALVLSVGGAAPLLSPIFTGNPQAPTPAASDNDASLATTAFARGLVAGVHTVASTGGTTTLTDDEAVSSVIRLTGALTSALTVVVPASAIRTWRVVNATTGSFSATLKVSGGGAGVAIPQGHAMLLTSDGADVAPTESAVGVLQAAGLVTANEGLEVGVGKSISGRATIGGAVVQLLAYTSGSRLQVGSVGVAHGSTDFVNNGAVLARLDSGGNLGVGTSSPSARLHVEKSTAVDVRVASTTSGNATLTLEAGVAGSVRVNRSGGALVLGTAGGGDVLSISQTGAASIGAVTASEKLNVGGNILASRAAGASIRLADQLGEVKIASNPDATTSAADLDVYTAGLLRMRVKASGTVGIGLDPTAATYRLAVSAAAGQSGAGFFADAGAHQIVGSDNNVAMAAASTAGTGASAVGRLGTLTSHALAVLTNGAEVARFDTLGNLALGSTSPTDLAGYRTLSVRGSSGGVLNLIGAAGTHGRVYGSSTDVRLQAYGAIPLVLATNGADRLTINSLGAVGIGIDPDATYRLNVEGGVRIEDLSSATGLVLHDPSGSVGQGLGIAFSSDTVADMARIRGVREASGGNLDLLTNASNTGSASVRVRIRPDGKVGIGTTAPTEALHVVGNIKASGLIGNLTGDVDGDVSGSAGSVPWVGVSGRPTDLASFTNGPGYLTLATVPVKTVAGRSGDVTLAVADVTGAAPLLSPIFTGNPTAPTPAASDNDTSIATTAWVHSVFSAAGKALKSTSGYQELPGGLIIQWGRATAGPNPSGVTFPRQFPNACFSVLVQTRRNTVFFQAVSVWNETTDGFDSYHDAAGVSFSWVAIGW